MGTMFTYLYNEQNGYFKRSKNQNQSCLGKPCFLKLKPPKSKNLEETATFTNRTDNNNNSGPSKIIPKSYKQPQRTQKIVSKTQNQDKAFIQSILYTS